MRTVPWFERLDAEGVIAGWLASHDPADHAHAIEVMLGAAAERADRMAELLAPYAGQAADYPAWLSWITRFGNLHKSRPCSSWSWLPSAVATTKISSTHCGLPPTA